MRPYLWRHGEERTCPQVPRASNPRPRYMTTGAWGELGLRYGGVSLAIGILREPGGMFKQVGRNEFPAPMI